MEIQRRFLLTILCLTAMLITPDCRAVDGSPAGLPKEFGGVTPLQWSVRMADSETTRRGDSLAWRPGRTVKWDYAAGLFTLSLLKLNEAVPTTAYVEFSKDAIGSFIADDGKIHGYQLEEYSIDNIAPGRTAIALYELTKEERYKNAPRCSANNWTRSPAPARAASGISGVIHRRCGWTACSWARRFMRNTLRISWPGVGFHRRSQTVQTGGRTSLHKETGLFYHGWDEKRVQEWANHTTGTSSNFWGRGLGWFAMAQVDVLDYLPKDQPGRSDLIALVKQTANGIVKWQDQATGLWWQVLDKGGKAGNYREATASAMFVYSLAKAVNHGYLSRDYIPAILKGYNGIITQLIKTNGTGKISLSQCCSVAGLGYGRDGSYDYYLREPVIDNDLKGVGPFILAGIEVQRLLGLPMQAQHD